MNNTKNAKYPVINLKATGKNIERLRKQRGISVTELQEYFGFSSPQAIYKWQWGESLPSIDNLVILSELFKAPIERILSIEKHKPSNSKTKAKSTSKAIPLSPVRHKPRIRKKRDYGSTQKPA